MSPDSKIMNKLYKKVYQRKRLSASWKKIHENGNSSKAESTRKDVARFAENSETNLNKLRVEIKNRTFNFQQQKGIPIPKSSGSYRPIVQSPITNRIVQRSILTVLQADSRIKPLFQNEFSYGGIEKKSVKHAINHAYRLMNEERLTFLIRSDIQEFFTKVPRPHVINRMNALLEGEEEFKGLLNQAVTTELSNMEELGKNSDLFPLHEVGGAQGCCLSPLVANIFLEDFDREMNTHDVRCIRYIDDFLLLAPNEKSLSLAFQRAEKWLKKFNLNAYSPYADSPKAEMTQFKKGLDFLGCTIIPGLIRPSTAARTKVLTKINEIFDASERLFQDPTAIVKSKKTYTETMFLVSNIAKGWGNQYSFCNHQPFMRKIDECITKLESDYTRNFHKATFSMSEQNRRRIQGLHLIQDSKYMPLLKPAPTTTPPNSQ